jgi:hypothetical protein
MSSTSSIPLVVEYIYISTYETSTGGGIHAKAMQCMMLDDVGFRNDHMHGLRSGKLARKAKLSLS